MGCRNIVRAGLLAPAFGAGFGAAAAQPLGSFHWRAAELQPSMAVGADGLPTVAHYIKSGSGLRVTKCGTPSCQ